MSYCGTFEVEEDRVVHRVLMSSLAAWTGTVQERQFEIEDERLTLVTMPLMVGAESPTGCLVWDRVEPGSKAR